MTITITTSDADFDNKTVLNDIHKDIYNRNIGWYNYNVIQLSQSNTSNIKPLSFWFPPYDEGLTKS